MGLLARNLADLALCVAVVGCVIAVLHGVERVASRSVARRFGWHAVLVTGWIGVPLHELSHLLLAKLFGHRIVAFELFEPDPSTGTLGYVWHAYRRRSPWQLAGGFFIGIAPLVGGVLALGLLMAWMTPGVRLEGLLPAQASGLPLDVIRLREPGAWLLLVHQMLATTVAWLSAVWQARTLWLPVQLYLAIAVASHMAPSGRDLQSALPGLALLVVLGTLAVVGLSLTGRAMSGAAFLAPLAVIVVTVVAAFQVIYSVTLVVLHASIFRTKTAVLSA